jgi:hypothetical protein
VHPEQSRAGIVHAIMLPECATVRAGGFPQLRFVTPFASCPAPQFQSCASDTVTCAMESPLCYQCLASQVNSSVMPPDPALCDAVLRLYDVTAVCQPCPAVVDEINTIVLAIVVVGAVSVAACLVVVLVILAHGRDRVSMRDRIVLGLMIANAIYSGANVIPVSSLRDGTSDCGRLAVSFGMIRFGRALWLGGKFGLVCFELFILAASMWALLRGARAMLPRWEATAHVGCLAVGTAAAVYFWLRCNEINDGGYNGTTEGEALSVNAYTHINADDDLDDDQPAHAAAQKFDASRAEFDHLLQEMLQVWLGVLGTAIVLWGSLRWAHHRRLVAWREQHAIAAKLEAEDEWVETRRTQWEAHRTLHRLQQDAYRDVTRPLEPYVLIFILFGIPVSALSIRRREPRRWLRHCGEAGCAIVLGSAAPHG